MGTRNFDGVKSVLGFGNDPQVVVQQIPHVSSVSAIKHCMPPRYGRNHRPGHVVAELAKYGIEASAGLVQKVKIELMKDTSGGRRQKAKAAMNGPRPRRLLARLVYRWRQESGRAADPI